MSSRAQGHAPSISDASVKLKTGRDWKSWFKTLDESGARKLDHRAIAHLLVVRHKIPGWWSQTITVEYERARGRRARHESPRGFAVAVTKTLAASLPELYAATSDAARRKLWFPKGVFKPSSQTKDRYLRGSWNANARLAIGFYAKGSGKSQIAIQVAKLAEPPDVEAQRAAWKAALARLRRILEA